MYKDIIKSVQRYNRKKYDINYVHFNIFAHMSKELKSYNKNDHFFMANVLVENYNPFTETEGNLMILLVSRLISGTYNYRFSIKEVLRTLDIAEANWKSQLIPAIKGLRKKYYTIEYIGKDLKGNPEKRISEINLLSHIDFPDDLNLDSYVQIGIDSEMVPFLFDLKDNFTVGLARDYLKLRGVHAKKLFLLLVRRKEQGVLMTTVDELQRILGTKYKYNEFNRRVLRPCVEQIEKTTDSIQYIKRDQKRKGRNIHFLSFAFNYQEPTLGEQLILSLPPQMGRESLDIFTRLVDKHRLTKRQASIIMDNIPIPGIRMLLSKIDRSEFREISSYTVTAFKNEYDLNI